MEKTDNELIAEFMEWEHCNSPTCAESNNLCWYKDCHSGYISKDKLKFDTSWDWLMPVVHKILIEWIPTSGTWPFEYTQLQKMLLGSRMHQVYSSVVSFIKWYNSQKQ
jgi:hypothetical protein